MKIKKEVVPEPNHEEHGIQIDLLRVSNQFQSEYTAVCLLNRSSVIIESVGK